MENGKATAEVNDERKFGLGRVLITPAALQNLTITEIAKALQLHARGDWGFIDPEDWKENDAALIEGRRLLSAYHSNARKVFWIITERDRHSTTILLPDDY